MKFSMALAAVAFCAAARGDGTVVASASSSPVAIDTRLDKSTVLEGAAAPRIGGTLKLDGECGEAHWFVCEPGETPAAHEFSSAEELDVCEAMLEKFVYFKGAYADGRGAVAGPVLISRLPVVYIDTDGAHAVVSKTIDYGASMRLQGNSEWNDPKYLYDGRLTMHVRGNSTADTGKKPYKLKLDSKTDILGMGKNKHWVLLSNPYDFSLLRNKIFYDLSAQMGLAAMDSTWVDVVMNGVFMGNYQLCEHVRIGETRIDVFDWEGEAETVAKAIYAVESANGMTKAVRDEINVYLETDLGWMTSGEFEYGGTAYAIGDYGIDTNAWDVSKGYLFELDNFYDEVSKFHAGAGVLDMPVMLNRPEYLCTNPELMDLAKARWDDYWEACVSADGYNSKGRHYSELSDLDSMVSYWLTMVIAANVESDGWSRYAYVGDDGKIIWGPVWDFDNSCGGRSIEAVFTVGEDGEPVSVRRNDGYSTGWNVAACDGYSKSRATCFYPEWSDDPYFCLKLYEKFSGIRDLLDGIVASGGTIDRYFGYLLESGVANAKAWAGKVCDESRGFYVSQYVSFDGQFSEPMWMKSVLASRIAWMRGRMGSVGDTVAALGCLSSNPYVDSHSSFVFDFGGLPRRGDSAETHTPDVLADASEDLEVSVSVIGLASAERVDVYVNGLSNGTFAVENGSVAFSVPGDRLSNAGGNRNMVSLVAKDGEGVALAATYALVTAVDASHPPKDMGTCEIALSASVVAAAPGGARVGVSVVDGDGVELVEGVDYEVSYVGNSRLGVAKVVVSGTGNWSGSGEFGENGNWVGSAERTFTVVESTFADASKTASLDTRAVENAVRAPLSLDEILPFAWSGDSAWSLGASGAAVVSASLEYRGETAVKTVAGGDGEGVSALSKFPAAVVTYALRHADESVETAVFDLRSVEGTVGAGAFIADGLKIVVR